MIDVQYTRAFYSLSIRLRQACKIREQTYIAASNVAVFSYFLFADFILHKYVRCVQQIFFVPVCVGKLIHLCDSGVGAIYRPGLE